VAGFYLTLTDRRVMVGEMNALNLILTRINAALTMTMQYFGNPEVILVIAALLIIVSFSMIIARR
jgi:hypothetical protein